jgi:hypothetical protein
MNQRRWLLWLTMVVVVGGLGAGCTDNTITPDSQGPTIVYEVKHDISPPLRTIPPALIDPTLKDEETEDMVEATLPMPKIGPQHDPIVQNAPAPPPAAPLAALQAFDGIGQGFIGPQGTFTVTSAPPDTNGDVGPNHYVQTTNSSFAIFNKSGTVLYGAAPINTVWAGFGGPCQNNNDGDPMLQYDQLADRWIISQFAVTGGPPYYQCVAISTTNDPTGSWYRYSFQFTNFNDYPKLSVWPDAYYVTYNMFTSGFVGATTCAMDRAKMLVGQTATQQCFALSSAYGGLLASDLDGPTPPPAGTPNYVLNFGTNSLNMWKFHVDWTTPALSTFTGPTAIATAAFSPLCNGGTCVAQPGNSQQLASLADRLMYRLAYRNFGAYESLVVNHSVTANSSGGVRWYELRNQGGTVSVYQQGTFAPDATTRWMGSAAMDQSGDIALGYSLSSSSVIPSIGFTGRLANDVPGVMTQGETILQAGGGTQTATLNRWGDYSALTVDPLDDCTFWFTTEYLKATGRFNWSTKIGSFKLPGCGPAAANDFSITPSAPTGTTIYTTGTLALNVATTSTKGVAETVTLSASNLPSGVTASFSPATVQAGGSSTLTLTAAANALVGLSSFTITGTSPSITHNASQSLTVAVNDDFSLTIAPPSQTVSAGAATTFTLTTALTHGAAQNINLSVSGLAAGVSASFSPATVTSGQSSTLTLTAAANASSSSGTFAVTAAGVSTTKQIMGTLTVNGAAGANLMVNGDFELGNMSGWTLSGLITATATQTQAHSGTWSAFLGQTTAYNGYSTMRQTVAVPSTGTTRLTFWHKPFCGGSLATDWQQAQLRSGANFNTVLSNIFQICSNSQTWTQQNVDLTPWKGTSVTFYAFVHDDGVANKTTYWFIDDVSVTNM